MAFRKGKSGNPKGGKKGNKGGGRTPEWYKVEARKIGNPLEVLQFYFDVSRGEELEQVVTDSGETIRCAASVKDRLKAGELYLDRHPDIGPIMKKLEHSGSISLEEFVAGSYDQKGKK